MMLDHPGIVDCYDVIDDGQQMVIVMVRPRPAVALPGAVCAAQCGLSWPPPVVIVPAKHLLVLLSRVLAARRVIICQE